MTAAERSIEDDRAALLKAAVANAAFDGFVPRAIDEAAKSLGLSEERARLAFPEGPKDVLRAWSGKLDAEAGAKLAAEDLSALKIREKIARAVRVRIEAMSADRIAARRAAAFLAIPVYAPLGLELSLRTADMIWRAIGDGSTDFNYYTKRLTLTGVMTATLLFWFSDDSEDAAETWAFLDRRIENVMSLEKAKGGLKDVVSRLPDPFGLLAVLRYPSRGA